jgi:hypothetical protein
MDMNDITAAATNELSGARPTSSVTSVAVLRNPLVVDTEALYRVSGMCDLLRDVASQLLADQVHDAAVLGDLVARYNLLRSHLGVTFTDTVREEMAVLTTELPADATLAQVVFAAASLSRFADLAHSTPQFLLAQKVVAAQARELDERADSSTGRDDQPATSVRGAAQAGVGQYL